MKKLLVLRHAHAHGPASAPTDFDRGLDSRGREQAARVGRTLRARGLAFDAIVASPALRVEETIAGLGQGAGIRIAVSYDPRIYEASVETLLDVIREVDDPVERLLIVGHNPGLQGLLLNLAEEDPEGLRGEVGLSYPTAVLAELCLTVGQWRDIGPGRGRIVSLIRPTASANRS